MCVLSSVVTRALVPVFFLPAALLALHTEGQHRGRASSEPTQLIVRFEDAIRLEVHKDPTGIVSTGVASIDALNRRYFVADVRPLLSRRGVRASDGPLGNVYLLRPRQAGDLTVMASEYENLTAVRYAIPDVELELYGLPDDSLLSHQWALHNEGQEHLCIRRDNGHYLDTCWGLYDADINAGEVFDNPPDNTATVVVAIIDSGIDMDHEDLAPQIWHNPREIPGNDFDDDHNGFADDTVGWDFYEAEDFYSPATEDNDPTDVYGHGTHCAGIVASSINNGTGVAGIVPQAKIMALKFYPSPTLSAAIRAIVYAAENGADVINMSWGAGFEIPPVEDALDYAYGRGVVLIAAAGNDGTEWVNYPSSYPTTVSVAATNDSDQVTHFSTYNEFIDVAAPGSSILSLRADTLDPYALDGYPEVHIVADHYYIASGTSMACPHVVGVAAYLRSVSPGLTPEMTKEILKSTTDDIMYRQDDTGIYPGPDIHSGHGRVNLAAALTAAPSRRATLDAPSTHAVVSGTVNMTGSADGDDFTYYILEYGEGAQPSSWTQISYSSNPVTQGVLGTWNTGRLEGFFTLRLRVDTTNVVLRSVYVVNTAAAQITTPAEGDTVGGYVTVRGTAACPDFDSTVLEYGSGPAPSSWTLIERLGVPLYDGEISKWDATDVADGTYSLRLSVYSANVLEATDIVTFTALSPFAWTAVLDEETGWTANYGDFDADGFNEAIVGTNAGVRFFNMSDGSPKTEGVPEFPSGDYRTSVAVGHLDLDGIDDVVAVSASTLYGFPSQAPPFQIPLDEPPNTDYFDLDEEHVTPRVFLKDCNNDGRDEIHYVPGGLSHDYCYVYRPDGSLWIGELTTGGQNCRCQPADLDGNDVDEIYCYGGRLTEFDTLGQPVTSFHMEMGGHQFRFRGMSAVDIDNDGNAELIVHGCFQISGGEWANYWVYAFDEGLALKPGWPHDMGIDGYFMLIHPVFADLDNDGLLEYMSTYYDYASGFLHVWRLDGSAFLAGSGPDGYFATAPNPAILSMPVVSDMDGNDSLDIVVAADKDLFGTFRQERILGYGTDAQLLTFFPVVITQFENFPLSRFHIPVSGDLNKDGLVDLLYASNDRKLVFANFLGAAYDSAFNPVPLWCYNRRLNRTAPPVGPQGTVSLTGVSGQWGVSSIKTGEEITFWIGVTNSTDMSPTSMTNGFSVYSPSGAEWVTTVGNPTGSLSPFGFDFAVDGFGIDGSGADTIGFTGVTALDGMPPGFDDTVFSLTIGPIDPSYDGGAICLDSAWFPPDGAWIWSAPESGKPLRPAWDGPYCFEVLQPCTITAVSPEAGDVMVGYDVDTIVWSSTCDCLYEIDYSTDGGMNWSHVPGADSLEDTCFVWQVPNEPSSDCLVRVSCMDHPAFGLSAPFTIAQYVCVVRQVPGEYATIQEALDASFPCDTVVAAAGTYQEHDMVMRSGVYLCSETGEADCVTIDAQQQGRIIYCEDVDSQTTIVGFTFTGGNATVGGPGTYGGALYCLRSSPSVENCVFEDNVAKYGGGVYGKDSDVQFNHCVFSNNTARYRIDFPPQTIYGRGGGLFSDGGSSRLVDCALYDNTAHRGGGVYSDGCSLEFEDCVLVDNTSEKIMWPTRGGTGGGLYCTGGSSGILVGCTLTGNRAVRFAPAGGGTGGGIHSSGNSLLTLHTCVLADNTSRYGAGLFCGSGSPAVITACTFSGNSAASKGGGAYSGTESPLTFENTILAYSRQGEAVACASTGAAQLSCCDVYGNAGGDWVGCIADQGDSSGNFSADPRFCDTTAGDFSIGDCSPCAPGNNSCEVLIGALGVGCYPPKTLIDPDTMYVAYAYGVDTIPGLIWAGQFEGDYSANDVDPATVVINESLSPISLAVLPEHPAFVGGVVELELDLRPFVLGYGAQYDTTALDFTVSGYFTDAESFSIEGRFTMIGHLSGDYNLDGEVNIVDLTQLVDYLFAGGPPPQLMGTADLNHDGVVNIVDLTCLVSRLFGRQQAVGAKPAVKAR